LLSENPKHTHITNDQSHMVSYSSYYCRTKNSQEPEEGIFHSFHYFIR